MVLLPSPKYFNYNHFCCSRYDGPQEWSVYSTLTYVCLSGVLVEENTFLWYWKYASLLQGIFRVTAGVICIEMQDSPHNMALYGESRKWVHSHGKTECWVKLLLGFTFFLLLPVRWRPRLTWSFIKRNAELESGSQCWDTKSPEETFDKNLQYQSLPPWDWRWQVLSRLGQSRTGGRRGEGFPGILLEENQKDFKTHPHTQKVISVITFWSRLWYKVMYEVYIISK